MKQVKKYAVITVIEGRIDQKKVRIVESLLYCLEDSYDAVNAGVFFENHTSSIDIQCCEMRKAVEDSARTPIECNQMTVLACAKIV